jgi:hypothetical protein
MFVCWFSFSLLPPLLSQLLADIEVRVCKVALVVFCVVLSSLLPPLLLQLLADIEVCSTRVCVVLDI